MAVEPRELDTISRVLHKGHRELRDLGNEQPGISFSKRAMRDLNLVDDSGVNTGHEVLVTTLRDGHAILDFQTDE